MLQTFIAIIVIIVGTVLWARSTWRKLGVLDENVSNAISQIVVQLSSRFDALTALLNLAKDYSKYESEALIETIESRGSVITAKSTPNDMMRQERIISEALGWIARVTERYPELTANPNYIEAIGAVEIFGNMIRTSCLIYNDSVTKINREVRMFPVSMIAGMLGFRKREYLKEEKVEETNF